MEGQVEAEEGRSGGARGAAKGKHCPRGGERLSQVQRMMELSSFQIVQKYEVPPWKALFSVGGAAWLLPNQPGPCPSRLPGA